MGTRKRYDGTLLKDLPPFRVINPYVMRGRNESAIYYTQTIEIESTHEFLRDYNRGRDRSERLSLFHILLAAVVRTIALRPQMNRFVSGQRIYQRNRLQVSFIVKKSLTDDGDETNAKITFSPNDTLETARRRIQYHVEDARNQEGNESDKEIAFFTKLPRLLLRLIVAGFKTLDYFGIAPSEMLRLDPLYTSVYVANLGSVGLDAPFHHLYEWGNASVFMVIGRPKRIWLPNPDGTFTGRLAIEIRYTIDDRITEGIYGAHSLQLFRDLVQNPERLMNEPELDSEFIDQLQLVELNPPLPDEVDDEYGTAEAYS